MGRWTRNDLGPNLHLVKAENQQKSWSKMVSQFIYLHGAFINQDRSIMHSRAANREGIQTQHLFYSAVRISDLPNFPVPSISCMSQNESLAVQLTGQILWGYAVCWALNRLHLIAFRSAQTWGKSCDITLTVSECSRSLRQTNWIYLILPMCKTWLPLNKDICSCAHLHFQSVHITLNVWTKGGESNCLFIHDLSHHCWLCYNSETTQKLKCQLCIDRKMKKSNLGKIHRTDLARICI